MLYPMAIVAALLVPQAADSTPRDTLVLAHEFTAPGTEFARVDLEAGQVYRVEIDGATDMQVRTLEAGAQQALVSRIEPFPRASRTIAFELRPTASTVYEVRVDGISRGVATLRLYWDASATARRQKLLHPRS